MMGIGTGADTVLIPLMLGHVVASLAVAEVRHRGSAVLALAVQSALLAGIIAAVAHLSGNSTLYWWVAVCVLTKVALVPALLWHYSEALPEQEPQPLLGRYASVLVLAVGMVVLYRLVERYAGVILPGMPGTMAQSAVAVAFAIIGLGLYVATVRRGTIKIILGVILMENGVHLTLLALAPAEPTTTVVGVTTNVVVLIWLMLYLTAGVYEVTGIADATELSELKR